MIISSKIKINIQTFIFLLLLSIAFFIFHLPVYSQEAPQNMLILDFKIIGGDQRYDKLEQELPRQLKSALYQFIKTEVNAELYEDIRTEKEIPKKLIGFPTDDDLRELRDSINGNYNYIIAGRLWEEKGIIRIEIRLIDFQARKVVYSFSESEVGTGQIKTIQERLAVKITKYIETYLVGKIRIGLIDFKKTGGDSKFCFLEESIPTMLATGLSASREFKLIEIKSVSEIIEKIEAGSRGIFDETTTLEIGRKINANYLIMGEFLEYESKIRVDARCVSIETGEIILSEEIVLERIEVDHISKAIKVLASKIRIRIAKDFIHKEKPVKSIAVVSYPPIPNYRINRLMAEQIRRTLVRKLLIVPELRVEEDPEKIKKYLEFKEDKLKICSDLEVSTLFIIQFEELHGNMIILNADLYDIEKPTQELYFDSESAKYKELNKIINTFLFRALEALGINKLDDEKIKEIKAIKVQPFPTRWAIKGSFSLVNRVDKKLYPKQNTGDYFELSLCYQLNNRMKIELQTGIDIGSRSEKIQGTNDKRHMSCMLFSLPLKFDMIKTSSFDIYVGLGVTVFQVFRNVIGDSGLLLSADEIGAGLMTLFGINAKFKKFGMTFNLEPRYIFGTNIESIVWEENYSQDYEYPEGRLGGFYFSLGIGYGFNL